MPNKIDGYKSSQPLLNPSAGKKAGAADGAGSSRAKPADAGSADQLTLTQPARELQQVAAAIANAPVVDPGRVESAKRAIDNGTYQVNAGKIADSLLQLDKLLR